MPMRYKKHAAVRMREKLRAGPVILMIAAVLCLCVPLSAAEEKADETAAEILVIYPKEADRSTADDSLAAVARALYSLRYTAFFAEAEKAKGLTDQYDYVIWCDVSETGRLDPLILENYQGALLALGRGSGLEKQGVFIEAPYQGDVSGNAVYAFDGGREYHSSVTMLEPGRMRAADETDGQIETAAGVLPLVSAAGSNRYIPLADYTTPFAEALLTREIARWRWPYKSKMHVYTQYVTLDPIYPFADPVRLLKIVDSMVERKMPFVISVMPIYEHEDYPAMERFCDVLRYAQSNGGTVILHAPLIQNGLNTDELAEHLTTATVNYLNLGVYPAALEIPSEWLFCDDVAGILGRYRTLFLSEMDAFAEHSPEAYCLTDHIMQGHQQIVPAIALDETLVGRLSTHATSVYLDFSSEQDERLEKSIEAAAGSPIPLQSLWDMDEAVYLNDGHYLTWDRNTLTVDGIQRFTGYVPGEAKKDFDYKRNAYYRFVRDLAGQNHTLIGISIAVLIIFLLLGRQSRKQMHRRFLTARGPEENKEESDVIR